MPSQIGINIVYHIVTLNSKPVVLARWFFGHLDSINLDFQGG